MISNLKKRSSPNRLKEFTKPLPTNDSLTHTNNYQRLPYTLAAGSHQINLGQHTCLMGIINMSPDSFSHDGFSKGSLDKAVRQAIQMTRDGADILDIGGESTRPGARRVSTEDEIDRVIPLITKLAKSTSVPLSIDTYKATVAQRALDAGACIVNNIMGVRTNNALLKQISRYQAAMVIMHIRGTPRTMQKNVRYGNLCLDILRELKISIENALAAGIAPEKIIIDPGIGFGKTLKDNLIIIKNLSMFQKLSKPILIGTSRKSFIGKITNTAVSERLAGTLASTTASILNGAHIVRVHDIAAVKQTALVADAILNAQAKEESL